MVAIIQADGANKQKKSAQFLRKRKVGQRNRLLWDIQPDIVAVLLLQARLFLAVSDRHN
jgi:hypothetical protein